MGAIVAVASFSTLQLVQRNKRIDDAMDVFSVHGMTGFVGALLIGAFILSPAPSLLGETPIYQAASGVYAPSDLPATIIHGVTTTVHGISYDTKSLISGIYYSSPDMKHGYQFGVELAAACLAAAYSFVITSALIFIIV
ncbi:ammonium transporter, partial [bacterium]|nr:ammonium transporter [bacterium]